MKFIIEKNSDNMVAQSFQKESYLNSTTEGKMSAKYLTPKTPEHPLPFLKRVKR